MDISRWRFRVKVALRSLVGLAALSLVLVASGCGQSDRAPSVDDARSAPVERATGVQDAGRSASAGDSTLTAYACIGNSDSACVNVVNFSQAAGQWNRTCEHGSLAAATSDELQPGSEQDPSRVIADFDPSSGAGGDTRIQCDLTLTQDGQDLTDVTINYDKGSSPTTMDVNASQVASSLTMEITPGRADQAGYWNQGFVFICDTGSTRCQTAAEAVMNASSLQAQDEPTDAWLHSVAASARLDLMSTTGTATSLDTAIGQVAYGDMCGSGQDDNLWAALAEI